MALVRLDNLGSLARAMGLPKFAVTGYVFQADRYYKTFRIPKRSGRGFRIICAPSKELKGLQRWILAFILRQVELSSACTGFHPGSSILKNAQQHVGKDFVLNLDIEDFFPTITVKRVVGLFKSLGYSPEVSFALGKLTTYQGRLPQGAPSSPDISNLIARGLDNRITRYCARTGWTYTRYCDDITISGIDRIGEKSLNTIRSIITSEGFKVNERKTKVFKRCNRQLVTGLVVNDKVSVPRQIKRRIRGMLHLAKIYPERFSDKLESLRGFSAFFKMVAPNDPIIEKKFIPAFEAIAKSRMP